METKINTHISPSQTLQRRLTAYSTLAAAGACAVAITPKAEADLIYSGPLNLSVSPTVTGSYFNLTTFAFGGSYAAVNVGDTTAPALNLWGSSSTYAYLYPSSSTVNRFVSTGAAQTDLAAGAPIGPTSTYGTSRGPAALGAAGGWVAGTTGYLGIKFLVGAQTDYGWVQIYFPGTPSAANPTRIIDAAYDNTGLAVTAGQGQVPEPGTVGCLAAGALGVAGMAWRRRKALAA